MQFEYSPYTVFLMLGALISAGVSVYAWARRNTPSAPALAALAAAIAEWSFCYALEIAGADLATKLLWGKLAYIGIATVPIFWFIFALNHANQARRLSHPYMLALAIIPTITIILALTTERHGLLWKEFFISDQGSFSVLGVIRGVWFIPHFLYSYLWLLTATVIVLRSIGKRQGFYRGQTTVLVIGVLIPLLGNLVYLLNFSRLDLTPFGFMLTTVALSWGIYGFRLIDLSPLARDTVLEEMQDGIIVLDDQNRVADINPAAQHLINQTAAKVIGKTAQEVFAPWPHLTERFANRSEALEEICLSEAQEEHWYELRLSPLYNQRRKQIGRVITIRNITDRKQAEASNRSFLDDMKALQLLHLELSEIDELETLYIKMIALSQQRLGWDRMGLFLVDETAHQLMGTYGISLQGEVRNERYYHEDITDDHWSLEILNAPNHAILWDAAPLYDNAEVVGTGWKVGATLWNGHRAVGYLVCDNLLSRKNKRPYEVELISLLGNTLGHLIERKRAEERIRQLSRAVEASPASIVITNASGAIEYVNPKFTQVTGYSLDEARGQNPRILKSDLTPVEVYRQLWDTITRGEEWRGEICNRKKDGELYWEFGSISPIANEAGQVTHYIAVKEDITAQRSAREQLQRQNEYLSVLHQITLDLLNRRNVEDLLQAVVERACVLLDAPYGEIMLKDGDYLVVRAFTKNQPYLLGDRVDRSTAQLSWKAHDTRQPVILEDYWAWKGHRDIYDGDPLHAIADFPVIAGDECIGILALGRSRPDYPFAPEQIQTAVHFAELAALVLDNANLYDSALREIEERKKTEALLQDSEARFRQIVENAGDAIYRADVRGRFVYANPTFLRWLGFSEGSEVIGKYFYEVVAPEWRTRAGRFYLHQFARQEKSTYFELPVCRTDGQEIWVGQNVQIIQDGEQVIGFQAVARDITALKRAQEALSLARDQALEASRLKSQLLAKVSHELRTPLGGILGYAELLHTQTFGPLNDSQKQAAGQIVDSTNYLNTMVNELLDQAQIEARTMFLRSERFSPAALLQKVTARIGVLAHNKGLAFDTLISPDLPQELWGDERRLQQILINLAGNAVKFTKAGQVSIHLTRVDGTHWAMKVADTGMGIPAEAHRLIFEPFRQVDNAITRENRGTGLGLSITQQLVELMGGQISLHSEVGQGSTFTVLLPILKEPEKKP